MLLLKIHEQKDWREWTGRHWSSADTGQGSGHESGGHWPRAQNQAPPLIPVDMESIWQKCLLIHN